MLDVLSRDSHLDHERLRGNIYIRIHDPSVYASDAAVRASASAAPDRDSDGSRAERQRFSQSAPRLGASGGVRRFRYQVNKVYYSFTPDELPVGPSETRDTHERLRRLSGH